MLTATLAVATAAFGSEVTYRNKIKDIFDARCNDCHGESSPEYKVFKQDKQKWLAEELGPRMDSYTPLVYFTGWPDTGALMRLLDDVKPGNMYQHLGENEPERQQNVWNLRKAGLGLLMSNPGDTQPHAFVEDSAVDPGRLREYIERFAAILETEGVDAAEQV